MHRHTGTVRISRIQYNNYDESPRDGNIIGGNFDEISDRRRRLLRTDE